MHRFLQALLAVMFVILPMGESLAETVGVIWEGTWYRAMPNRKGITKAYCEAHAPGTFRHVLQEDGGARPIITSNGVRISHTALSVDEAGGIYLVHGKLVASGTSGRTRWRDSIDFYLYKLTEQGITRGVWSTPECKGLYRAVVVEDAPTQTTRDTPKAGTAKAPDAA
ncbi:hypothetical protein Lgee_1480 [Legionella geestiana]|uniref:Uncharacterized protein n=1 Tax=Legionella geestiana TaxID=45065 RepID=A0A0W0TT16_9GAMM|nr:hypothetical protein [Legionella geestiana]KTC98791.1 hypothetical protein Lgee_1480 [Legionella geestiana]QBS12796.1 hypothetical protein E4T54_08585 [Legionella geestiana]QDQ39487.1 hypothetical protein E3226_003270 [Legionella geestiana]STX54726.1 Uncharacterised protein [Legionella geestiana]